MDTKKIQDIARSLETMKNARFVHPNWAFIGLNTGFRAAVGYDVIRTAPLNEYHCPMTDELNSAIKPVLDKYIKIFSDELAKCV